MYVSKNRLGSMAVGAAIVGLSAVSTPALAGSVDLFGIETNFKLTLGYAASMRTEDPAKFLSDGPIDQQQVRYSATLAAQNPDSLGIQSLTHTGLPLSTNFDDGSRDFKKGALIGNRASAYGELHIGLKQLGIGNVGLVGSGAAHYDRVFFTPNDHTNTKTVNRADGFDPDTGERFGPINEWTREAQEINGKRIRMLEAYVYGDWYLTDSVALNLRAGKHLAAWGESLFFPGIVAAQGPFDATKAFVPGADVKEILLPVNQVSMQLALNRDLTVLAYKQFEYKPTEIFPQGDFFSPADLVGPGATFGYGSINPIHENHCTTGPELAVTETSAGDNSLPDGDMTLCAAGSAFTNRPEYVLITRDPDNLPDPAKQWGVGLKYQLLSNLGVGAYHLNYHNHNPNVALNMGYAFVGNAGSGQPVTTENFGDLQVPTSYTVGYADNIKMNALSFSTVFWVFNVAGEVIRRTNVDTSLEAEISGVKAPWGTRGQTTQAQISLLYVNNPNFLMYDEVIVIGEFGYLQVDKTTPQKNQNNVWFTGTNKYDSEASSDVEPPADKFSEFGNELFYDRSSAAMQILVLPKGRNVVPGWDIGTPVSFAWLYKGTPSAAGAFGALYGEGDMRASIGVTAQYLQNMEFSLNYNGFFGNPETLIRNSDLAAHPYTDKDYLSLSVKYNL